MAESKYRSKKAQTVHAFKQIEKDVKSNALPHVVMLYGSEDYLIRWARGLIKKTIISPASEAFDYSVIDAAESSTDEIIAACQTFPMMSEKRIVLISGLKLMGGQGGKAVDEDAVTALIENVPDTCQLVLTGKKPDARRRAYKYVSGLAGAYDFSRLDNAALTSFINKRFRKAGKSVSVDVIPVMIESSGYFDKESDYNLDNLENDITKIIAYSGKEIEASDILETLSGNLQSDTFLFLDSLCDGKKSDAFKLLGNILSESGNELKVLGAICSQFEMMLSVKEMKEEGYSFIEMKETLQVHEFRIKKAASFVQRYTVARLKNILMKAYAVEKDFKSGALDARLALEMFVAAV